MKLEDVKRNIHKTVLYNDSKYYLQSCVLWLDEKDRKFKYSLILIDKNKNSTVCVLIEKVEAID